MDYGKIGILYEGFQLLSPQKIILARGPSGFISFLPNIYYVDVFLIIVEDAVGIGECIASSEFTIDLRSSYFLRIKLTW